MAVSLWPGPDSPVFSVAHVLLGVRGRLLPCDWSFSYRKLHRSGKNPRNMKPSTLSSLTSNSPALTLCLLVPGTGRRGESQAPPCRGCLWFALFTLPGLGSVLGPVLKVLKRGLFNLGN